MKRSVPLITASLLAGCGFPYTPRALPSLSTRDPASAPPAAAYTPPRQSQLAGLPVHSMIIYGQRTAPLRDAGDPPARSILRR